MCSSQDEAVHEYGPLQRLVGQTGTLCIGHFMHLERKTAQVLSSKRMRVFRLVTTKDAAAPS